MTDAPDKLAKLPKWAAQEIQNLRRDLTHANGLIATMHGEGASNTHWERLMEAHPIPANSTIRFTFEDGTKILVRLEETGPRERLLIMGNGSITLEPGASNVVRVKSNR